MTEASGRLVLASGSAASDGGFVGISDVSRAISAVGGGDDYRLVGGVAVMLHVLRTDADVPVRATGDADYGVPPHVLKSGDLVAEIEKLGYQKTAGNRWERQIDSTRSAAVDLLVPAYTSRPRQNVRHGDVTTTEVPGLAVAFLRPPVEVSARFLLSDGGTVDADVLLPDALSMLALKAGARSVRFEARDATDLWRCLEVAYADGVRAEGFAQASGVDDLKDKLAAELTRNGRAIAAITADVTHEVAGQRVTRIQALLREVAGI